MIETDELAATIAEKELKFIDVIGAVYFYKKAKIKIQSEIERGTEKQLLSNLAVDVIELYFALPEEVRLLTMMKSLRG